LLQGVCRIDEDDLEEDSLRSQLKKICIQYKINNPFIGDE